jgi:uncharacterized protein YutE (UPF0331/DUF86 family)
MLDKEFIKRKIKLIQEELAHLEDFASLSFDEVAKDYMKLAAVERLLEKIITRAIDINQHILAEKGKGSEAVRRYEETFIELAQLGVYSEEFGKAIAPSAGLRNRLVHEYDSVDEKIVYNSVGEALSQYTQYCDSILKFIEVE